MAINKINHYDICKTFKEWLAENEHRFNLKCKVRHYKTRGFLRIYFEGVTPEIFCSVVESGCIGITVGVQYRRRVWDLLCDFDCNIKRAKNREYYCSFCNKPLFYKTPQKLLIDHSFEPFLEWVNCHLTSSHVLELREIGQGSTEAIIVDLKGKAQGSFNNLDNIMTTRIPVIKGEAP
jgi:hypothetical protein